MLRDQIREKLGPLRRYEVADVNAAIALADDLRRKGVYDLFRGQEEAVWPVRAGAVRVEVNDNCDYQETFQRNFIAFHEWLGAVPEGLDLVRNFDFMTAVMQHYCGDYQRFKTYLIDFTIDPAVAGFFAAEKATPGDRKLGCIVCISSLLFELIWNSVHESNPGRSRITILRPEVPDLWRLQAQQGVFVQAAIDLEQLMELDRIVFPVGAARPATERSRIYPERRSRLEDLLERYFAFDAQPRSMSPDIVELFSRFGSPTDFSTANDRTQR